MEQLWIGVPIFFVISGYCIAATVDTSRRRSLSIQLYFVRRFRRIFPPYLIFGALSVPIAAISESVYPSLFNDVNNPIPSFLTLDIWQIIGKITLTEGWRHHVVGSEQRFFLAHAWTLGYEEQFYIVSGLVLMLFPRRFFLVCAIITLAALLLRNIVPSGFFLNAFWLQFAAGILVYYATVYTKGTRTLLLSAPLLAGMIFFGALYDVLRTGASDAANVVMGCAFALLILALRPYDDHMRSAKLMQPFF